MRTVVSLGAGLMLACNAAGQSYSVWLPESKELVVTPGYVFQTFDEFWLRREKMHLRDDITQHKALVGLEYGVTEKLTLDLTSGYVWRRSEARNDDGLADTAFGVRYRWLDEETIILPFLPSIGLRVGGNIEGSYDEHFPLAEGDGASGAEASLLLGKAIWSNFGWFGDIGYRYRNHDVSDELFGSTGIFANYKFVTLHVGYRHTQSLSGGDIGEVPFPEVKELNQNLEAGIGFTDKGNRYYQLFYAHTLTGRNTGEKDIFGIAAGFSF